MIEKLKSGKWKRARDIQDWLLEGRGVELKLSAESARELGRRYAEAMIRLLAQ